MNITVLGLLFPTVSAYYWDKITELRDSQLESTLSTIQSSTEAKGVSVVSSMSLSIREAVAGFDFSFINALLHQVVSLDQELRQCVVMDANGVVFSHNEAELIGAILNEPIDKKSKALFTDRFPAKFDALTATAIEVLKSSQGNNMYIVSPVYNGNSLWGILRCAYSTELLDEQIQATKSHWQTELGAMRSTFITIAILFFLLAVGIALLFTGRFVKAINQLISGVKRVAGGDLKHTLEKKDLLTTEFESFASAFNDMTVNLKLSHEALDEHNRTLEDTVKIRTAELEATNKELEAFSYSVSHDLRSPLRSIDGFSSILLEDYEKNLDEEGKMYLNKIRSSTDKMNNLITGMLTLSRVGRREIKKVKLNINQIISNIVNDIRVQDPNKANEIIVQENMIVIADKNLMNIVFENLLSNAWKYSSKRQKIVIEIGTLSDNPDIFFIKDNGAGFDMKYADQLFSPYKRLHKSKDFEGTGVGLATVSRIMHRHSGEIWADSKVNGGTTFYFSFVPGNRRN